MKSLQLFDHLKRLLREKKGQRVVEYRIILFIIALSIVFLLTNLGDKTKALFMGVRF